MSQTWTMLESRNTGYLLRIC